MAIIISVPEQTYTQRVITLTPTVSTVIKAVTVSLTRVGWPAGKTLSVELKFPDGSSAGTVGFNGGVATRNGSTVTVSSLGLRDKNNLPQGQYEVIVSVLQTLTTAVTVDVA